MLNLITVISEQLNPKIVEGQGPDYPESMKNMNLAHNFRLPITYLEESKIHTLSKTVSDDLELTVSTNKPIYEYLFQPKHKFGRDLIPEWNKQYSTATDFLNDSKQVLKNMNSYSHKMTATSKHEINCELFGEIWKETKENEDFYLKYGFIDWNFFKYLNRSPNFLEAITLANIVSPVLSLLIPVLLLIFPFIILRLQNIPINFEMYCDVLKTIAQHHFIGKAMTSLSDMSLDKLLYLAVTFGFYLLQIYQNINQCRNFYQNMATMNTHLCEMKSFVQHSIQSMETFIDLNKDYATYGPFIKETERQLYELRQMYHEFENIQPFEISIYKFTEMGYMLKCYYELHCNDTYESALRYACGFAGYIDNLSGVFENLESGRVHFAEFSKEVQCDIQQQYYPPLAQESPVKNDCSLRKNIIISSPNAGGKTTMIKTTTLNVIFSQQVGCGFYNGCTLQPYTHIHSYLNIPDTSGRDSLFQAESRRCKEIIDVICESDSTKARHFCIFDELFSGTNPLEATKSAFAFLKYLSKFENVSFVLTTHYISVCKRMKRAGTVQNYKMDVIQEEDGSVLYTYKMKKGISRIQGAVKILEQMNYPPEIIQYIKDYK
jgi:MutS domain V